MAKPPNVGTLIAAAKRIIRYFSREAPVGADRPSTLKVLTPEELSRIARESAESTQRMIELMQEQVLYH